jgi:hypothetical protein
MVSCIVKAVKGLFKPGTYGSDLEKYIISRYPQNVYDVEKLTMEYHNRKEGFL